jgi:hypothetical protein
VLARGARWSAAVAVLARGARWSAAVAVLARGARRSAAVAVLTVAVALGAAACGDDPPPPPPGHLALGSDPAGRLVAVVQLCAGQRLTTLTLRDETSGTTVTVRPKEPADEGGTIILTGPIGDPRPEGLLDLLDRRHEYTLSATTETLPPATPEEDDEDKPVTGTLAAVRFKLSNVLGNKKLRDGSVLSVEGTGTAVSERTVFLDRSRQAC